MLFKIDRFGSLSAIVVYNCHDLEEDLMGTKFFIFVKYVVYDWG